MFDSSFPQKLHAMPYPLLTPDLHHCCRTQLLSLHHHSWTPPLQHSLLDSQPSLAISLFLLLPQFVLPKQWKPFTMCQMMLFQIQSFRWLLDSLRVKVKRPRWQGLLPSHIAPCLTSHSSLHALHSTDCSSSLLGHPSHRSLLRTVVFAVFSA